jgi:hypothetical protein
MNYFKYELWSNDIDDQRRAKLQQTAGSSHVSHKTIAVDKSNQNHPPPSATINTIHIATNKTKVSYVTSFWAKVENTEIHPHRSEVEAALLANIQNPHLTRSLSSLIG